MSATETETYNGWTNRETWAVHLWLSNDEGLYEMSREALLRIKDAANEMLDDGPCFDPTCVGKVEHERLRTALLAQLDAYKETTRDSN